VADQTKEWTDMVMRQMAEEHEMLKSHICQLSDLLKELMEDAQDLQLKELELRQEKYAGNTYVKLYFIWTVCCLWCLGQLSLPSFWGR